MRFTQQTVCIVVCSTLSVIRSTYIKFGIKCQIRRRANKIPHRIIQKRGRSCWLIPSQTTWRIIYRMFGMASIGLSSRRPRRRSVQRSVGRISGWNINQAAIYRCRIGHGSLIESGPVAPIGGGGGGEFESASKLSTSLMFFPGQLLDHVVTRGWESWRSQWKMGWLPLFVW